MEIRAWDFSMEMENSYYLTALFHWVVLLHCHKLQLHCGDLPWRNLWSLSKICPFHADLWLSVNYSLTVQPHDLNPFTFYLFSFLQQLLTGFCFHTNCSTSDVRLQACSEVNWENKLILMLYLYLHRCARLNNGCFLKPLEAGLLLSFLWFQA